MARSDPAEGHGPTQGVANVVADPGCGTSGTFSHRVHIFRDAAISAQDTRFAVGTHPAGGDAGVSPDGFLQSLLELLGRVALKFFHD